MPISKAQQKAVAKYTAANYDELKIRVPKGRKQDVEAAATKRGESVNGLVNGLLQGVCGLSDEEWRNAGERPEE